MTKLSISLLSILTLTIIVMFSREAQCTTSWNSFLQSSEDGKIFPANVDQFDPNVDTVDQLQNMLKDKATLRTIYDNYKTRYQQPYVAGLEQEGRDQIFANNLIRIAKHNVAHRDGVETWAMGITPFSDMTTEERVGVYNQGPPIQMPMVNDNQSDFANDEFQLKAAPSSFDWRNKNVVTPAKNQNNPSKGIKCGSCSIFAAMAAIEGSWARNTNYKQLKSFSEQEVMDCGGVGCSGAYLDKTFDYVKNNKITTDSEYPYTAQQSNCKSSGKSRVGNINSFGMFSPAKSENDLKDQLVNMSPFGAQIKVADSWHDYKGDSVYTGPCGTLDHAVAIVGYGNQDGKDYWIVKNQWGQDWGNKGFMKLIRGENKCNIASWVYWCKS